MSKLNLLIEPALGFKTLTFLTLGDSFKSNTILDVLALKSAYLIPLITPVACGNEKSLLNLTLYKSTTILEGLVNAEISCFIKLLLSMITLNASLFPENLIFEIKALSLENTFSVANRAHIMKIIIFFLLKIIIFQE